MPPQKTVAMGKRGRGPARARKGSAKPKGTGVSKSGLRIKLSLNRAASQAPQDGTPPPVIHFDQNDEQEVENEEDTSLPVANPGAGATRSGRVSKKRQDPAYAFGSEMDHLSELSSAPKVDDEDVYQPRNMPNSPLPGRARE
jgi:hypothetical protein